jgi:Na+-driven multidrug efflux pump
VQISIFLSLSRQLLFLLPLVLILPHFWGLNGVWYSLPASDGVAAVITAIIMWNFISKNKKYGMSKQQL